MALTIGAIILLIGLIFLIYYGYTVGVRRTAPPGEERLAKCSLCQQKFDRAELIERQVGDSKLYYFCKSCVMSLDADLLRRSGKES